MSLSSITILVHMVKPVIELIHKMYSNNTGNKRMRSDQLAANARR